MSAIKAKHQRLILVLIALAALLAADNPAAVHGINSEGLKRRGFSSDSIMAIKRAYKTLYKSGLNLEEAIAVIRSQVADHDELRPLADFLAASTRGIVR